MNGLVQKAKELGLDTSTALAPRHWIYNHPSNWTSLSNYRWRVLLPLCSICKSYFYTLLFTDCSSKYCMYECDYTLGRESGTNPSEPLEMLRAPVRTEVHFAPALQWTHQKVWTHVQLTSPYHVQHTSQHTPYHTHQFGRWMLVIRWLWGVVWRHVISPHHITSHHQITPHHITSIHCPHNNPSIDPQRIHHTHLTVYHVHPHHT